VLDSSGRHAHLTGLGDQPSPLRSDLICLTCRPSQSLGCLGLALTCLPATCGRLAKDSPLRAVIPLWEMGAQPPTGQTYVDQHRDQPDVARYTARATTDPTGHHRQEAVAVVKRLPPRRKLRVMQASIGRLAELNFSPTTEDGQKPTFAP
jgi:hypothetical protein